MNKHVTVEDKLNELLEENEFVGRVEDPFFNCLVWQYGHTDLHGVVQKVLTNETLSGLLVELEAYKNRNSERQWDYTSE